MAQAKITINGTQAKALGLLVYRKKINPKTNIMYEPMSGVNFRQTGPGDYIEVPDDANIYNLKQFFADGQFDVIEGKIADVTSFIGVKVTGTMLSLLFDQPVYTAALSSTTNGAAGDDLVVTVDGVKVALDIGAILKANSTKSITVDLGSAPTTGVSVKINAAGAAKIKDAGDVAVTPATKTIEV